MASSDTSEQYTNSRNQPETASPSLFGWITRRKVQGAVGSAASEIEETREPFIGTEESDEPYALSSSAELSGTNWYNMSSVEIGLVVSGSLFGALIGSIIAFNVADILGRRRELIVAAMLYIIGALVSALAPALAVLIVGCLLFGFGIGLAMHAAPLYIAETSPSQIRGTLISLKELFIVLGILLGYLMSSLEINVVGGWRYMYGVSAAIGVVMAIGMWWLPPSPRWLLLQAVQGKGNLQELKERAISSLSRLRGRPAGDRVSDGQIEETLRSLQDALEDQEQEANFWEIFQGSSLKALTIGGGLVLFQQIRGRLVSLKEFFIVLGMLLGYVVSNLAVDVVGGWRYMYGVSTPIAVIMGIGMWWLPPSPRWILLRVVQVKGNVEELKEKAVSSLNRLRGRPAGDKASYGQIEENLRSLQYVYQDEEKQASIWEVFQGSSLKALIIGAGLVFFQQVTGQPSVLYYAASILQSAGFSAASDATRVSIYLALFKLLMTVTAVLLVDKLGRRPLLIPGASSIVSFGPIGWLMISEIFPLRTRGRGISVAVLVNFAANALVTFSFSPLQGIICIAAENTVKKILFG